MNRPRPRPQRRKRPVHSHWAEAPEPTVGGSTTADREVDPVFAPNDHGKYDAPAIAERRAYDNSDQLDRIPGVNMDALSQMQMNCLSSPTWRDGNAPDVALRQGISESTDDNRL